MMKCNLKDDTVTEIDLKKVDISSIYPRDSKVTTNEGFVDINKSSLAETHCICWYIKDNKSFWFW